MEAVELSNRRANAAYQAHVRAQKAVGLEVMDPKAFEAAFVAQEAKNRVENAVVVSETKKLELEAAGWTIQQYVPSKGRNAEIETPYLVNAKCRINGNGAFFQISKEGLELQKQRMVDAIAAIDLLLA